MRRAASIFAVCWMLGGCEMMWNGSASDNPPVQKTKEQEVADQLEKERQDRVDEQERALRERDTREWVERAMTELDETYRTAIELRYMAEKSYEEIAAIMQLPEGTVKTYVHRGKIELKRILSRPQWRAGSGTVKEAKR